MAKILIIDDSKSVRTDLRGALEASGHEVIEAEDGKSGLDAILANRELALVISDLHMPGFDGIEMLKKARAAMPVWNFKVFMLTTDTSEQLKAEGKAIGITAWAIKPFDRTRLMGAVDKILALKASA